MIFISLISQLWENIGPKPFCWAKLGCFKTFFHPILIWSITYSGIGCVEIKYFQYPSVSIIWVINIYLALLDYVGNFFFQFLPFLLQFQFHLWILLLFSLDLPIFSHKVLWKANDGEHSNKQMSYKNYQRYCA